MANDSKNKVILTIKFSNIPVPKSRVVFYNSTSRLPRDNSVENSIL